MKTFQFQCSSKIQVTVLISARNKPLLKSITYRSSAKLGSLSNQHNSQSAMLNNPKFAPVWSMGFTDSSVDLIHIFSRNDTSTKKDPPSIQEVQGMLSAYAEMTIDKSSCITLEVPRQHAWDAVKNYLDKNPDDNRSLNVSYLQLGKMVLVSNAQLYLSTLQTETEALVFFLWIREKWHRITFGSKWQ